MGELGESGESGASLLEAVIAMGILACVLGVLLNLATNAIRHFGPDPYQEAIDRAAAREAHIAADLLKYSDATLAPASLATTVPLPSASPLPVQLVLDVRSQSDGSTAITVRATSSLPVRSASANLLLAHRAPPPGANVIAPATVAAPTGAP